MEEIAVTGIIRRSGRNYVIATDDGKEYHLSAILPWEAVSPDYNTHIFELNLGRRMTATGLSDGNTIYKAMLSECNLSKS